MPISLLFRITAFIEASTGIGLVFLPNAVARLLLGKALDGSGLAVATLAGIALFALGVMAWAGRDTPGRSPALAAMMTYNVLAAPYLAMLSLKEMFSGPLLLPAILLHGFLGVLLVHVWWSAKDRKF
jgi:hypothetical protein